LCALISIIIAELNKNMKTVCLFFHVYKNKSHNQCPFLIRSSIIVLFAIKLKIIKFASPSNAVVAFSMCASGNTTLPVSLGGKTKTGTIARRPVFLNSSVFSFSRSQCCLKNITENGANFRSACQTMFLNIRATTQMRIERFPWS
jgi:hypothetical protein